MTGKFSREFGDVFGPDLPSCVHRGQHDLKTISPGLRRFSLSIGMTVCVLSCIGNTSSRSRARGQ